MNSNKILTNSYNPQSIPVQVFYFLKNKIISYHNFFLNTTFGSILQYYEYYIKEKGKPILKKEYILKNKKISLKDPLINLIELKKNISPSLIESVEIFIELEEGDQSISNSDNNTSYKEKFFEILLQPKINPFGLFVYKVKEGLITLEQYPEKIYKKYELEKYSNIYSSHCNSPKNLYISGGKMNNNKSLNDFWIINNKKYSIIKKRMPYSKSNHSMIYINLNFNEYIFIVGGDNNLNTFYYDINLKCFIIWTEMNSLNIKPALYQYNQYLYSFNNLNSKLYLERTNLIIGKPAWEKIEPKFDANLSDFKRQNFGICNGLNDDVIILGGDDDKNIIIYDINKNILSEKKNCKNINISLLDKTFYSINKTHSVILPSNLDSNKEIIIVNKIKYSVRKMNFETENKISLDVSLREYDGDEKKNLENNNDIGIVIVKAKISEKLRYDVKPEIVEEQKLTLNKKENKDDNNKDIIKIEYRPLFHKNEYFNNKKVMKKKEKLYIPNNVVYNNFVNLLVDYTNKNKSILINK